MKLKAIGLVIVVSALGVACSKGGDGNGGRNTPRGLSPSIVGEYSKPQAYNQKAVTYLQTHSKKSNAALPPVSILLTAQRSGAEYDKLDTKGKGWFDAIAANCSVENPPKMDQGEGKHTRTESIGGGTGCPFRYTQTEAAEMAMNKSGNVITISGQTSLKSTQEVIDPQMQADTDSVKMIIELAMGVQGDAVTDGEQVTDMAVKMAGSGRVDAVMLDGTISADFKMEMFMAGNKDTSSMMMVVVANVRTPEGDIAIGAKMQNGEMEFRVGGKVVTPKEFGEIFGPLPGNPGSTFLASEQ